MDILKYFVLVSVIVISNAELEVKWCVTSLQESDKCEALRNFINRRSRYQIRCVPAASRYECWRWIKDGKADLIRVDDTEIYAAGELYGLKAVAKETFSIDKNAETFLYKSVVVIKKDGPIRSLYDLRGRKSCHTGVRKTAGWVIPVASLLKKGLMSQADCDNTVKSVATFFKQSCSPGAFLDVNNPDGDNPANVCEICEDKACPIDDKYSGYFGALACLTEGLGDIAFIKHSTIDDAIQSGMKINKESLALLCNDGSRRHVNEWKHCSWATRPTDVIVTSPSKNEHDIGQLRQFLESLNSTSTFKIFQSSNFYGKDLIFSDGIHGLTGVGPSKSEYKLFLDAGFQNSMENFTTCDANLRWCVTTSAELDKCNDIRAAMISKRLSRDVRCILAASSSECIDLIEAGTADVTTLVGSDVYAGGRYHGIVPIAAETYKNVEAEGTSYWAVAVVNKNNRGLNIKNLRGSRSCHTGIMETSGWVVPVGLLMDRGYLEKDSCNITQNVGIFFKESCVPGALDPEHDPLGIIPESLCQLCGGKEFCKRDYTNKYFGYEGAIRCLVEKNADVAFVKHSTVPEIINSSQKQPWSQHLRLTDFELLCQDGSRKPLTEWATCNLAQVPSHTVVTSANTALSIRKHYQRLLSKLQYYYNDGDSIFHLFRSPSGSKDAIFKDITFKLTNIPEFKQTYKTWLDPDYLKALEAMDSYQCDQSSLLEQSMFLIISFTLISFFINRI